MSSNANFDWTKYAGMNDAELIEFLDGAELEEVRRRKLITYIYYRQVREKHELELKELIDEVRKSLVEKYGEEAVEELEEASLQTKRETKSIENTQEYVRHMFDTEKLGEKGKNIEKIAKDIKFTSTDVNAVGMAVLTADEKADPVVEKIINAENPKDDPEIDHYRLASAETMENLLMLYKEGVKEPLAQMMKAGLLRCCQNYANCKNKTESVKWSGVIGDILDDLEKKPELKELCGFTEQELDAAHGAVVIGEIIKNGMKALEEYQDAALSGKDIPREKQEEYSLAIIQMEMVFADREKQMDAFNNFEEKTTPSALQNHIGKNITVERARKGVVAPEVENLKIKIKKTEVFKKIQKADVFTKASVFSKTNDRRNLYRDTIKEIDGINRQNGLKTPEVKAQNINKAEVKTAKINNKVL